MIRAQSADGDRVRQSARRLQILARKRRGNAIELTPCEMKVLALLFRERGNAVSRENLLNEVWGVEHYGTRALSIN